MRDPLQALLNVGAIRRVAPVDVHCSPCNRHSKRAQSG